MPPKLPRPRIFAALAIIAVVALGSWLIVSGSPRQGGAPGQGGTPVVTVGAPLKRQVTEWSEFTGQFTAVDYVEIRARVGGFLTEVHFTDGQMVQKGDLLFVIDPRPYEFALASARARLDQAASTREFANRQLGRADELQRREVLSKTLLDQRSTESRGAGAAAEAARSAVREAELNLQFTRVHAPISGRIGARLISPGNLVTAGGGNTPGTLLSTVVSLDPLYLSFDMSEADFLTFQRTRQGATDLPVDIRLMDETKWTREGRLTFVDNQLDKGSGTIRARATLANPDRFIAPGSFGRIRMPASAPYDALLVPDAALVTDQSRKLLMTVTAEGIVTPKPVELGQMADGLRVVKSGLGAEDQVIINGLMRARPGAKVTAQPGTIGGGK